VAIRLCVEGLEARALPAVFRTLPILPFNDLAALDHARATFALGRQLGRQPDVLLKIGDSNSSPFFTPNFLAPLGNPEYNPLASGLYSEHANLLAAWWAYRSGPDSLAHEGPTAQPGWRTDNVLGTLAGEIRATNAAIALVMIGTNDAMVFGNAAGFRDRLSLIVTRLLKAGVVPVLSTLPDSHVLHGKYESTIMAFNQVMANVAERFAVPLWNAWRALHALPNQGIITDGVHLNASSNGGGSFWPADLGFAQNLRNLEALQILDWFQREVVNGYQYIAPEKTWQPLVSGQGFYAVSRDADFSPTVDVYDAKSKELVDRFLAFRPSNSGGVRVEMGDTNGDGFTDIICASHGIVKVISGADGSILVRFVPFRGAPSLRVAVGDLDGDGADGIVVARGTTGAIKIYEGKSYEPITRFGPFKHAPAGISIAVADIAQLGPVIVVASGRKNPTVRYFDPAGNLLGTFTPFDGKGAGMAVEAVDLDGDGSDEIVVGRSGSKQRFLVFDGVTHTQLTEFDLDGLVDPAFGIRIGVMRSPDGPDTLLVGNAPGSPVSVRGFDDLTGVPELLPLERSNRAYGIFVG
jgi:hypothetical protein